MPTGRDKSLLYMLPALCSPEGITVVVVPLIALRNEMHTRRKGAAIKCHQWNPQRLAFGSEIELVTPESALTEAFQSYVNLLKEISRLDRIVIDECHVMLNDQITFRKQLQRLGELDRGATLMILLNRYPTTPGQDQLMETTVLPCRRSPPILRTHQQDQRSIRSSACASTKHGPGGGG